MTNRLLCSAALLLVSGCSEAPSAPPLGSVRVVARSASAAQARLAGTASVTAAPVAAQADRPGEQANLLSVADSAQLQTSEMWSEPIAKDGAP